MDKASGLPVQCSSHLRIAVTLNCGAMISKLTFCTTEEINKINKIRNTRIKHRWEKKGNVFFILDDAEVRWTM